MLEKLIAMLAPHQCLQCGIEGSLLCQWCLPDAVAPVPDCCYSCRSLSRNSAVCVRCRKQSRLRHVWVRSVYRDAAHDLVYKLKFGRVKATADVIAELLDDTVPYLDEQTVVTFVPTATKRVRLRGYDQTKLIAQAFARKRRLRCRQLVLPVGQARQVGASKKLRQQQAAHHYRLLSKRNNIATVLVIDDVVTTGATIEAVASLLRTSGVKQVDAAVFAQR